MLCIIVRGFDTFGGWQTFILTEDDECDSPDLLFKSHAAAEKYINENPDRFIRAETQITRLHFSTEWKNDAA